jgi:diketogulonate reductase-like aldo/keto reductase
LYITHGSNPNSIPRPIYLAHDANHLYIAHDSNPTHKTHTTRYVDLLLIHNPCTNKAEYHCSGSPHFFELKSSAKASDAIPPASKYLGDVRGYIFAAKLKEAEAAADPAGAYEIRKRSWLALEEAHKAGKAKYIGVSNYTADLLLEMKSCVRA